MLCRKCGSNNPDGINFCPSCGTSTEIVEDLQLTEDFPDQATPPKKNEFINKIKKTDNRFYKMVGIVISALRVIIIGICVIIPNIGINGVINKFEKSIIKYDIKTLNEIRYPKKHIKSIITNLYDGNKSLYDEELKEESEELQEAYEFNKIKVVSIKKAGKPEELEDYLDWISRIADYGLEEATKEEIIKKIEKGYGVKVQALKKCKVKIKALVDGDTQYDRGYFVLYKTGGKWYVYSFGNLENLNIE